ncbi:hypothetical protein AK830_g9217 [Neonectria ditissima]|uniref:Uncharacterized protein n=1 Tax=Neonectria ditissima TaxID=78410 RepID=A0A0P7AIQ3_9HYPO|nr:hypothetical protein AK830_g9217 [Neonectria ditissima]
MSDSEEALSKYWKFSCPDEGNFYICENDDAEDDDAEFVGCCKSDPCSNGGVCPDGELRTASFAKDKWEDLPPQVCYEGGLWYTCKYNNSPFMGCCMANPCAEGSCARDQLAPAVLAPKGENRQEFLEPSELSTETTTSGSSSTATASEKASTSAAASDDGSGGLSTGAIAGIAAGAGVLALFVLGFLIWRFCWVPRRRKQTQTGHRFEQSERSPQQAEYPGTPGNFVSQQSPMSHYQHSLASTPTVVPHFPSGVSMDTYGKPSPQTAAFDRPVSTFSDASSGPNRGHAQPYSPPMYPVQEMDGTTNMPQELSTGQEQQMFHGRAASP